MRGHRLTSWRATSALALPLLALVVAPLVSVACQGCRRARMPARSDGAAAVVIAEPADPSLAAADEVEPNDLLASAQRLDLGAAAALAVAGRLVAAPGVKAKDVDLYRLIVPPPAVVTADADGGVAPPQRRLAIEVRPDRDLAVSVDALDEQGRTLATASGTSAGEPEGMPNLTVLPGTVFVRVRPVPVQGTAGAAAGARRRDGGAPPGAAAGPAAGGGVAGGGGSGYRLIVRLLAVDPGDEVEPNGKGALAGDVAAGGEIAGFLGWRHDEDWYRIPLGGLIEGSVLDADLDPLAGVAASLVVYDSVEHKVTEQRGRRGERVAIRNVRLPSSEPHMYLVVRADSGRNLEERYVLHLKTEEAKADAELEPNDDPAHAVTLVDGTVAGYLAPADVDVYRYTAASPVELDVQAAPPPKVDMKLEVLREDGTVLMRIDGGKRREPERLPNLYVAGTVLLRLAGGKGDGNLDEPYQLTVASRPAEAGAEREPNGTAALATPLAAGGQGAGLIFPRGDVDFWMAQPPSAAAVAAGGAPAGSLGVSVRGVPGMTLDVRVLASSGKELARFRVGGDASAPTRVASDADGCCLVQIREASGRGASARERYALTVTP